MSQICFVNNKGISEEILFGKEFWQRVLHCKSFKTGIGIGMIIVENEELIEELVNYYDLLKKEHSLIVPPRCSGKDLLWLLCRHLEAEIMDIARIKNLRYFGGKYQLMQ